MPPASEADVQWFHCHGQGSRSVRVIFGRVFYCGSPYLVSYLVHDGGYVRDYALFPNNLIGLVS